MEEGGGAPLETNWVKVGFIYLQVCSFFGGGEAAPGNRNHLYNMSNRNSMITYDYYNILIIIITIMLRLRTDFRST